uniref:hypothetical protein n=1 Tax=Yoonia sp. TaxID=2212373 RepID=UPI004048B782
LGYFRHRGCQHLGFLALLVWMSIKHKNIDARFISQNALHIILWVRLAPTAALSQNKPASGD